MGTLSPLTKMGQHVYSDTVATEYLDPSPWQTTSDCQGYRWTHPNGVCRYADAAFFAYTHIPADSVDFGYIARTTFKASLNTQPGSRTINASNKHFEIASKYYSIPTGVYLDRLGQMGGWMWHNVSHACTTVYGEGTNGHGAKMWCQHKTGGGITALNGDSGGPLWAYDNCDSGLPTRPDGTACIRLAGVFWGEVDGRLIFSQIQNIEVDFGITLGVRPADNPF
jgi:hypothetical protein